MMVTDGRVPIQPTFIHFISYKILCAFFKIKDNYEITTGFQTLTLLQICLFTASVFIGLFKPYGLKLAF